MDYAHFVREVG